LVKPISPSSVHLRPHTHGLTHDPHDRAPYVADRRPPAPATPVRSVPPKHSAHTPPRRARKTPPPHSKLCESSSPASNRHPPPTAPRRPHPNAPLDGYAPETVASARMRRACAQLLASSASALALALAVAACTNPLDERAAQQKTQGAGETTSPKDAPLQYKV